MSSASSMWSTECCGFTSRPVSLGRDAGCGVIAQVKDRPVIELVDLPSFGRPTRLVWHKRRWSCLEEPCPAKTWTEVDVRIGAARMALSDRAGRWVTEQVGRHARSVNEVAVELACDSTR
jgi:hypothetical protein